MARKHLQAAFWGFGSMMLATVVALLIFWRTGGLERWELGAEARLIEKYIRQLQPSLPFEIERFEVHKNWRELFRGHISEVVLVLRKEHIRLRMQGPVDLGRLSPSEFEPHPEHRLKHGAQKHIGAQYHPSATVEFLDLAGKVVDRSPATPLHLWLFSTRDLSHVDSVGLEAELPGNWEWKILGLQFEKLYWRSAWDLEDGAVRLEMKFKSLKWRAVGVAGDHAINLSRFQLSGETAFKLEPLQLGPQIRLAWQGRNAEILWDQTYLDLPLHPFPIEAKFLISHDSRLDHLVFQSGQLSIEKKLKLAALVRRSKQGLPTSLHLKGTTSALPIREMLQSLQAAAAQGGPLFRSLESLGSVEVARGRLLPSDFTLDIPLTQPSPLQRIRGTGRLRLRDLDLNWKIEKLALRGLQLDLPLSTFQKTHGTVSIDQIFFRRTQGQLASTPLQLRATQDLSGPYPTTAWNMRLGEDFLPLAFHGLPLKIAPLQGVLKNGTFQLQTGLKMDLTPLAEFAHLFCIPARRLPPGRLMADLPQIQLAPGVIDPSGYARLELFEGFLELSEFGFFDMATAVPEIDFNLRMNQIRLDRLGEWLGFGEMDGILTGFAKEVTFQSWFPTQYGFRMEVKPFSRRKVVFSPDAMRNFVRLFAGESTDRLPGIAQWLAFGWPSRLFGGYDLDYAGISLVSSEGSIILETLDPPAIFARERKHFILYGPRFKMPLTTRNYPLVVDASAMGNFVRHMTTQLWNLPQSPSSPGSPSKEPENETEADCNPPQF